MEEVWAAGQAPVRTVMEALNGRRGADRAYTTYMTVMMRLQRKGLLTRRRRGKTDYYSPRYDRGQYMALRARSEVEGLVAQYGEEALANFARELARLDPAQRRAIQRRARQS